MDKQQKAKLLEADRKEVEQGEEDKVEGRNKRREVVEKKAGLTKDSTGAAELGLTWLAE